MCARGYDLVFEIERLNCVVANAAAALAQQEARVRHAMQREYQDRLTEMTTKVLQRKFDWAQFYWSRHKIEAIRTEDLFIPFLFLLPCGAARSDEPAVWWLDVHWSRCS